MSFDLKRPLQLGFRIHFETANPIRLFITFNSGKGGSCIIKREVLITKYNYKSLFIKSLDV